MLLNKKKFLYLSNSTVQFISHRLSICENLSDKLNVILLSTKNSKTLREKNIRFVKFDFGRQILGIYNEFKNLINFFKILKKISPDVVHSISIKPSLYSLVASLILNLNLVISITGLGYIFNNKRNFFIKKIIYLIFFIFKKKKYSYIFQNKEEKKFFIKNKFSYKNNSYLITGTGLKQTNKKRLLKKKYIVLPARMLIDKGIYDFCKIADDFEVEEKNNFKFILFGSLDLENKSSIQKKALNKIIKSNKNIKWIKDIKKIKSVFENCLIVCFPSYHEGSPRALIQALSYGIPIVCYDIPGCREIVKNGFNGYRVKFKNYKALKKKILILIKNKNKMKIMSKNAYKVAKKFCYKKINEEHYKIYQRYI